MTLRHDAGPPSPAANPEGTPAGYHDPAIAQSRVFLVFAVLMVALIPLILVVPDHRGRW